MTRPAPPDADVAPVPLRPIVAVMTAGWAVALGVLLLLPAGHEGERWWWPWTAAIGLGLGLVGLVVARRQPAEDPAVRSGSSTS
ncbi:MAG: DUF2530 domain-containing protein [Austwickia sp.]|jgi:hypothetical protein|nr:DUF2530 domain-containing protein [Austwickia sp.]MBK8436280.1 DUF2530 domain-containing protein [Austwickia sp.]MBK9101958.1 DUF2530 domain-containing protein [Austwickia sp.]